MAGLGDSVAFRGSEDPGEWLLRAQRLRAEGQYSDALLAHRWYHDHALEVEPGQYGVRLSYALSDWAQLAKLYPPARAVLLEVRDRVTRMALASSGWRARSESFNEALAIDAHLHDDAHAYDLIVAVDQVDAESVVRLCNHDVRRVLIAAGDFPRCRRWIGDPRERLATLRETYDFVKNDPRFTPMMIHAHRAMVEDEAREIAVVLRAVDENALAAEVLQQSSRLDEPE